MVNPEPMHACLALQLKTFNIAIAVWSSASHCSSRCDRKIVVRTCAEPFVIQEQEGLSPPSALFF